MRTTTADQSLMNKTSLKMYLVVLKETGQSFRSRCRVGRRIPTTNPSKELASFCLPRDQGTTVKSCTTADTVVRCPSRSHAKVQLGAVKLGLWHHCSCSCCMHPMTSENRFHCTRLYASQKFSIFVEWYKYWKKVQGKGLEAPCRENECPYQHPAWSPVSIGKPAPKIHQWTIYFCRWGFGWVDKAQCFRSARRFGAAGSSPDFSRVFHDMALLGLCLELSFNILYCRTQANPPTLEWYKWFGSTVPEKSARNANAEFRYTITHQHFLSLTLSFTNGIFSSVRLSVEW